MFVAPCPESLVTIKFNSFEATVEVPVTIRNQDEPIGTHVFTAVARTDRGLRWSAVTIDGGDINRTRALAQEWSACNPTFSGSASNYTHAV